MPKSCSAALPSEPNAPAAAETGGEGHRAPPVEATAAVITATPEVEPSAPAPAPAPKALVEPFVLPIEALQRIAESSGLQWVNSDAEKIQAAQAAMAAEPAPVHVPRERKPLPVIDEGPLVLVETRKDLSQLKLPFESGSAAGSAP